VIVSFEVSLVIKHRSKLSKAQHESERLMQANSLLRREVNKSRTSSFNANETFNIIKHTKVSRQAVFDHSEPAIICRRNPYIEKPQKRGFSVLRKLCFIRRFKKSHYFHWLSFWYRYWDI